VIIAVERPAIRAVVPGPRARLARQRLALCNQPARVTNREVLIPMIADATAAWASTELYAALETNGVPPDPSIASTRCLPIRK